MATAALEQHWLTIGQVASAVGLRASAIRYYEDAGLLPTAARLGGKRRYTPDAIERVLRESRECDCVTLSSCRFLQRELSLGPLPARKRAPIPTR